MLVGLRCWVVSGTTIRGHWTGGAGARQVLWPGRHSVDSARCGGSSFGARGKRVINCGPLSLSGATAVLATMHSSPHLLFRFLSPRPLSPPTFHFIFTCLLCCYSTRCFWVCLCVFLLWICLCVLVFFALCCTHFLNHSYLAAVSGFLLPGVDYDEIVSWILQVVVHRN